MSTPDMGQAGKGKTGFARLLGALQNSWAGLVATARHEEAFRQELILCFVLVPVALWLDVSRIDRILMIASLLLLMVVEILNSAIESTIDRIGAEHHELSGRAKDQGSAAVLIAMLIAVGVWVSALWTLFSR